MIIKCMECGKDVSTKASTCPNCGNPQTTEQNYDHLQTKAIDTDTSIMTKGSIECPFCHKIIKPHPKKATGKTIIITIILLCFYIIPGIIYIFWEGTKKQCPECNMPLS